jgi:hypothetical protein
MKCENHFFPHDEIPEIWSAEETLEYWAQTCAFVHFSFFRTHDRTLRKKEKRKRNPWAAQAARLKRRVRDGAVSGVSALESLLSGLADVPTPAAPTPLQLRDTALIQIEATD